jgi:hypothetical protein
MTNKFNLIKTVAVHRREGREIFVKRVAAVRTIGCEVVSAVPWGTSSRDIGLVPNILVFGKVFSLAVLKK